MTFGSFDVFEKLLKKIPAAACWLTMGSLARLSYLLSLQ